MKILSILLGLLLVLAFFGLGRTQVGLSIGFFPRWDNATPGELMTWVGYLALLLPAGCFIGYGLSKWFARVGRFLEKRIDEMTIREQLVAGTCLTIGLACLFRVLRALILLDLPITDDENSARFGGQILAGGQLMVNKPVWWEAAPSIFMYERDGMVTSFDWPGSIFLWAFSELSHTGPWIFMLFAAVPVAAIFLLLKSRHDVVWATFGATLLVLSPMFLTLSMTTHTHLGSRAFIALALTFAWLSRDGRRGLIIGFGATAAIAFLFRPVETIAIVAPVAVWSLFRDESGSTVRSLGLLGVGAAAPFLLFLLYNVGVTEALTAPRFTEFANLNPHYKPALAIFGDFSLLWQRFGANVSYNLLMLTVFIGGPLLMAAAFLGKRRDGFARALTASIFFALGVALVHDDYGIHAVGPIHYSETCLPIIILAIDGLDRFTRVVQWNSGSSRRIVVSLLTGCILTTGVFISWHCTALYRQAAAQEWAYSSFDGLPDEAVVFAPQLSRLRASNPEHQPVGGWVFRFRAPHPFGEDDVLILNLPLDVELADHFEGRPLFVAEQLQAPPWIDLKRIK